MQTRTPATVRVESPGMPIGERRSIPGWMLGLAGLLVVALVAVSAWFVIDEAAEPDALTGPAAKSIAGRLETAVNEGDEGALRALYADDALMQDLITPATRRGVDRVVEGILALHAQGIDIQRASDVIAAGDSVAFAMTYGDAVDRSPGLVLFQVDDGTIVRQVVWAIDGMTVTG
jgi:hypothetical protein